MSCLLPFPASHICCPPGLLVRLSPEPLQVLKASDATSTPAPTHTTPHRKSLQGCRVFLPLPTGLSLSLLRLSIPTTPTASHLKVATRPRPVSLLSHSWRLLHNCSSGHVARARVNNRQLPGGQNWGDRGGREERGRGALSCLFSLSVRDRLRASESKVDEMCNDCDGRNTQVASGRAMRSDNEPARQSTRACLRSARTIGAENLPRCYRACLPRTLQNGPSCLAVNEPPSSRQPALVLQFGDRQGCTEQSGAASRACIKYCRLSSCRVLLPR